jgi:mono/diheme cytochrome c family protein
MAAFFRHGMLSLAATTVVLATSASYVAAADAPTYNHDIRPILFENCFACHGPDSASRKGDLRLDKREAAVESGAIEPGKPDESEMLRRMLSDDPDEQMPPPSSHKKVTKEQRETIRRWIEAGANYEPHWSLIAPKRPTPPTVKNPAWVRNPIDNFILAALEAKGLTPAEEADRRTLARRLSLDLTGLPPAPDVVERFVADESMDAYEKLVDYFLRSPQWGEHRGRYWLDAARYADTHGIHFDNYREVWIYRDWVINAFNKNMPFDQFTIEQLAGDLLPNATLDQKIASGFNRCNITTSEGGAINEEYLVLYTRDRTETFGQVWLASTVGCAVCHDHKFDPVSQKEFYELSAFFNNTTQAAMDGNIKDTPPVLKVPMPADRARMASIDGDIAAAKQKVEERKTAARSDFDAWQASTGGESLAKSVPVDSMHFIAALSEGSGRSAKVTVEGAARDVSLAESTSWHSGPTSDKALRTQGTAAEFSDVGDFDKDQAFSVAAWIKLQPNDAAGAIAARMDNTKDYRGWDLWAQSRRVGTHIIHAWPNDALKVVGKNQLPGNQWTHVAVTYDGTGKAAGVKIYYNGELQETLVENDNLKSTIRTDVPFKIGQRHTDGPLPNVTLQDLRIYKRALTPGEAQSLAKLARFAGILAKPVDQRSDTEKNDLYSWWLQNYDVPFQDAASAVTKIEQEKAAIEARATVASVMNERNAAAEAYILFRGDYDKRRDLVKPNTPAALPAWADDLPRNRLGLAKWVLRDDQPITSRVTVNRYWQEVFGEGLVRTAGDFGIAGELPSNQELLDWMAVEFRESGWDIKKFFKLIVMSSTYRQAAIATPEKLEKDRDNRLLSRGPRFRMDAEMVRDYALASSGLLVQKLGGPSVKPYQPEGVWEAVAMIGSNTRDYRPDTGENLYRRSMYTFWKRAAPPASMEIFNAPNRETCAVDRDRTNTPLQAMTTLNDPQFIEAARRLAERALKEGGDSDDTKIDYIAKRLLSRSLSEMELVIVRGSLGQLSTYYQQQAEDAKKLIAVGESKADATIEPAKLAAWTMLVNQLMNLDEVLNK